jgi:BlaI family penicillinase repressor
MARSLPQLSRFELQVLRLLWTRSEASVSDLHGDIEDPPSYSTIRKIVERLESKGAIERVRVDGLAVVYRAAVPRTAVIRQEIRRFLDVMFDGAAAPLVAHLAEMDAVSLADLKQLEQHLGPDARKPKPRKRITGKEKP